jgi:RNA polymerase-binding protein DksA
MNSKTALLLKKELISKKTHLADLHRAQTRVEADADELPKDAIDRSEIEESWFAKERMSQHWKLELKQIETALFKIDQGTFGECEECGDEIPIKRLRVRPDAAYCLNCQETAEKEMGSVRINRPKPAPIIH